MENKNTEYDADLIDQYQESIGNKVSKVSWAPDETAVQETLGKIRAVMQIPKVYFTPESVNDEIKGFELAFRDELIERYEVTSEDGVTRITIHPLEYFEPIFSVTITEDGFEGDRELLQLFTIGQRTLDNEVEIAYNGSEIDIQNSNATKGDVPITGIFRKTSGDLRSNGEFQGEVL